MAQPNYRLKNDHVATCGHVRTAVQAIDAAKQDKTSLYTKIQDGSGNAAVSCDSSLRVSIKSNNNKLCDIEEDQLNQGMTINTYNKRFNLVSQQPQTHYVNSKDALFNFKFTGTSNTTTPFASNYGLLQIAPSGVTDLNPAVNIISSRINGLGSAGAVYLDSAYGQTETPLILSAQSLTDSNAASLTMYRNTATPTIKAQFVGKTGYTSTQVAAEANEFLTKAYADTLYTGGSGGGGSGGGSGSEDKIQTADESTAVVCVEGGVQIIDDSTLIAQISKDATSVKLKSELSGLILATDDLTITTKDGGSTIASFNNSQIQTTTSILQNSIQGLQGGHLTRRDYVDGYIAEAITQEINDRNAAIYTSSQNITQLVDTNQIDGNKYRLSINNNQLEFYRGATSEDLYLKLFGTSNSDGVVFQTNRSRYFFESENNEDTENYVVFKPQTSTDPVSMYNRAAQLSLRYGYVDSNSTPNAYAAIVSQAVEVGSGSTRILMYPKTIANNAEITNQVMVNARFGYESGVTLTAQNADSILKRSENDSRYYQSTTRLDQIALPTSDVNLNGQALKGLPADLYTEPYSTDHAASIDYVNQLLTAQGQTQAASFLTNADEQRFQPIGLANAFAVKDLADQSDKFIIQADVPEGSTTLSVGNSLRLAYFGTKSLSDDSLVTKADVVSIASSSQRLVYSFRVKLGDVPFSSGTAGVINTFTVDAINFPLNQENIVSSAQWVRQSGRSDTIRVLFNLDSNIVQNRQFVVHTSNMTGFVNSSGGPNSTWQFGDSTEEYIIQSFGLDQNIPRFFLHVRDVVNSATQNLFVNCSIVF